MAFIAGCFLTEVVCNAFNLVPGCIDPPSAYGSVNGIKFGRGMLCVTSGDLAKSNELFYKKNIITLSSICLGQKERLGYYIFESSEIRRNSQLNINEHAEIKTKTRRF